MAMTCHGECPYTIEDVIEEKTLWVSDIKRDFNLLKEFSADVNCQKHCGNKIIYHYQMLNLLNCRRGDKKNYMTLPEMLSKDETATQIWWEACDRERRKNAIVPSPTDLYEAHRINKGSIVAFKPSTAKYLFKKYEAKHVLDPTAGWGGRLLAAASLSIKYTGIDTNTNLREGYEQMIEDINIKNCKMIWEDCLKVDYTTIDADIVMTSPPYSNMEKYEECPLWKSDDDFYTTFMIPLFKKLDEETNCRVYCINVSPKMYKALINNYNVRECDEKIDMRQQMGQRSFKTESKDYTYVWSGGCNILS
tara:strand:+ start:517 stop:1434 length:918 start_codon:yes stop_codon:yes gene_type:complete